MGVLKHGDANLQKYGLEAMKTIGILSDLSYEYWIQVSEIQPYMAMFMRKMRFQSIGSDVKPIFRPVDEPVDNPPKQSWLMNYDNLHLRERVV